MENTGKEEDKTETKEAIVSEVKEVESTRENEVISEIYVHVCGSVLNPGLYILPPDSRADAAVKAAGGFSLDAKESAINLAQPLVDGMQIYIPSVEEDEEVLSPTHDLEADQTDLQSGLVNINTASASELMTLSGIGESKASAIVEYREINGSFQSVDDIKNVSGIGDGIYEKIKDHITV